MRNTLGVEIGGHTYYEFTLNLLKDRGGIITGEELEQAVRRTFGHLWGPEDRRIIRGKRAKWQNMLDWVKVMGHKQGTFFNRTGKAKGQKGKKVTYIIDAKTAKIVRWVLGKQTKQAFVKTCKTCGQANHLANDTCSKCGRPFPATTIKVQVPM